tara:strand:- start:559 stop:1068 length:510 start_codon:yes stop_codon:yes gene_type:complete
MVFLYGALGVLMISGIAAMMEVASNLSNFTQISAIKSDKYIAANLAKNDRHFLKIINDPSAPKSNICDYVIDQINVERSSLFNAGLSPKEIDKKAPIYLSFLKINNQEISFKTTSKDKRIQGSCVLINNELKHRVLINKNTSKNKIYEFSLFSCYIDEKEYCNFEENNK